MDADAMVRAVARWLPVERLPELIVEDMLADTIDIGITKKETRERLFSRHGTTRLFVEEDWVRTFFNYKQRFEYGTEEWYVADLSLPPCTTCSTGHPMYMHHRGGDKPARTIMCYRADTCGHEGNGITYEWFCKGKLHRDNGPAIKCRHMQKWYNNGEEVQPRERYERAAKRKRSQ